MYADFEGERDNWQFYLAPAWVCPAAAGGKRVAWSYTVHHCDDEDLSKRRERAEFFKPRSHFVKCGVVR